MMVDNNSDEKYTVERGRRLFQLAHPSLVRMEVECVEEEEILKGRGGEEEEGEEGRGEGGFGSTGE